MSGCSLKEDPKTMVTINIAYNTEEALEANVYGCYRGLTGGAMITGEMNEYLHICSGLLTWNGSSWWLTEATEVVRSAMRLTQYSNNPNAYSEFKGFYSTIARCNNLLKGLETSPVNDAYKDEIAGEAYFVRALCYYYLVRQWGSVPVYLTPVTTMEEANVGRTKFDEVYQIVINDLKTAESKMRDYNRAKEVTGIYSGRPCKWAATAFLSEVYLYIASLMSHPDDNFWDTAKYTPDWSRCGVSSAAEAWTKSLEYSNKVIDEGPYSLSTKYTDLFDWGSPNVYDSPERIFVITNTNSVTTGNYTAIRTMPEFPEGTLDTLQANNQYGRWRPDRWAYQVWGSQQGGTKGTATADEQIYVNVADPRCTQTIWSGSYYNLNTKVRCNLYPSENRCWRLYIQYELFFKKYLDPAFNVTQSNADFYVMRLAEMYLNAAEAAANLSSTVGDEMWDKAFEMIEILHARARLSTSGTPSAYPIWDSDRYSTPETTPHWDADEMALYGVEFDAHKALEAGIFWERIFEMMGEGHEFYDTHRHGAQWLRDNIVIPRNKFLRCREQQFNDKNMIESDKSYCNMMFGDNGFQYITEISDLRKSLLCAFPRDEFIYSKVLDQTADQNDFYWK